MAGNDDKLLTLLTHQEFLQDLVDAVSKAREESMYNDDEDLIDRLKADRDTFTDLGVEKVFSQIIYKMPRPIPIRIDDLVQIAEQQLAGIDFDKENDSKTVISALRRVAATAVAQMSKRVVGAQQITMGEWWADKATFGESTFETDVWLSESGFSLRVFATPIIEEDYIWEEPEVQYHCNVVGTLDGYCTNAAMGSAEHVIANVLPSISKTVSASATHNERRCLVLDEDMKALDDALSELLALHKGDSSSGIPTHQFSGIPAPPSSFTSINFLIDPEGDGRHLLRSCLDVWLMKPNERDPFQRRIANAVELLKAADEASSSGICLALCVAAIEAVVCASPRRLCRVLGLSKSDRMSLTSQIKTFVPALLMPQPIGRSGRGDCIRNLYFTRSKTLHGEKIDGPLAQAHDARQIASGVLRSVTHWHRHRLAGGETAEWEDLIREVHEAAMEKKYMSGVPDLSDLLPTKRHSKR